MSHRPFGSLGRKAGLVLALACVMALAMVAQAFAAPVVGHTTLSPATAIPSPVTISCPFTDAGVHDAITAVVDWGDGIITPGDVSFANGAGVVTGSHVYLVQGVYAPIVTVSDNEAEYYYYDSSSSRGPTADPDATYTSAWLTGNQCWRCGYAVVYEDAPAKVVGTGTLRAADSAWPQVTDPIPFAFTLDLTKGAEVAKIQVWAPAAGDPEGEAFNLQFHSGLGGPSDELCDVTSVSEHGGVTVIKGHGLRDRVDGGIGNPIDTRVAFTLWIVDGSPDRCRLQLVDEGWRPGNNYNGQKVVWFDSMSGQADNAMPAPIASGSVVLNPAVK